jgi:hypothetical protein
MKRVIGDAAKHLIPNSLNEVHHPCPTIELVTRIPGFGLHRLPVMGR